MPSNAKSFLRYAAIGAVSLALLDVGIAYWSGPIVGDLTRLGAFAERDYAPQRPQAPSRFAANQAAIERAGVVVLGDSFSESLAWQGELEASKGVVTFTRNYNDFASLDDWLADLTARRLAPGTVVILETVEREFGTRFREPGRRRPVLARAHGAAAAAAEESTLVSSLNISHNLRVGYHALTATGRRRVESGQAVNVALRRTDLFSNRCADRLLYYAGDDEKARWREGDVAAAVQTLLGFQQRLREHGLRLVVLLIPDKSTVYRDDLVDPIAVAPRDSSAAVFKAGLAPVDLLAKFVQERAMRDLYLPNDTHLSPDGYRLVAGLLAASL